MPDRSVEPEENEVLREARLARALHEAARRKPAIGWKTAGAIGSAAVIAAMLYARHNRK